MLWFYFMCVFMACVVFSIPVAFLLDNRATKMAALPTEAAAAAADVEEVEMAEEAVMVEEEEGIVVAEEAEEIVEEIAITEDF